jgi:hypothetical protein
MSLDQASLPLRVLAIVAVEALESFSRVSHYYNSVREVDEIQFNIEIIILESNDWFLDVCKGVVN